MIKRLFAAIIFLTLCNPLFSQTITIEYTKKNNAPYASFYGLPELMKKDALAKRYFTLIISNNKSEYYKTPGQAPIIDLPIHEPGQYVKYGDEAYYYKDYANNLMLFEFSIGERTLKGKDELLKMNWGTAFSETKKIAGYKCKKAITTFNGVKCTAWYTTELPENIGPDKFGGLPGTILGITLNTMEYKAKRVKISNEDTEIKQPVFNTETSTYNEYIENYNSRRAANEANSKSYGNGSLILVKGVEKE